MAVPIEPPVTPWVFPPPRAGDADLVALGGDLDPGTVLAAYRRGLFPMPVPEAGDGVMGWFSPDPRAILPLDGFRESRSLRSARRRFAIRVSTDFEAVMRRCADPRRPHGWITEEMIRAYRTLHRMGWAHSVEAWTADGVLAGGLYGLAVGGLFAGESMFHDPRPLGRDASKVALAALVDCMRESRSAAGGVLDVQWLTPHLASLGAVEISRSEYLARVERAVTLPQLCLSCG